MSFRKIIALVLSMSVLSGVTGIIPIAHAEKTYEVVLSDASLESGSLNSVKLTVASQIGKVTIIGAAYDEHGALTQIKTAVIDTAAVSGAETVSFKTGETGITVPDGGSYKIFAWKGETTGETMEPAAAALSAVPQTVNHSPSEPTGLLTNELENPLNVEAPTFGWIVNDTDKDEIQTAYEIVVTDEITGNTVWDSGKVTSSEQSYVAYSGDTALETGHPYSWMVKTWDKDGEESPYSDAAYFSTGLNAAEWAKAAWISDGTTGAEKAEGTYNHYWYVRTEKDLAKTVKAATAYFAGVHDYDLYVNGTEIGRGQSFDYSSETRYQGWDITDAVKSNADSVSVGALVRTYGGGQGRAPGNAAFIGYIKLYYTDGMSETIATNTTDWTVSKTTPYKEINSSSALGTRNGEGDFVEVYTASHAQDFTNPSFTEDSTWTAASARVSGTAATYKGTQIDDGIITNTPIAELSKPTSYIVEPKEIKVVNGKTIADFGVVIPARPEITFKNGTAGTSVTITGGYMLSSDGTVATGDKPQQSTTMTWTYNEKDGEQTYHAWDHLGFRYLQISDCGETFTKENLRARVVHTNVPDGRQSTLVTSNETLNKVYTLMQRSALYGIQNEFVDTPTREKGQFTDDARNISEASMATQFEREASRKAIMQFLASADRFWRDGEGNLTGRVNSVYPNVEGGRDIPEYSVNIPQWVWNYYMQTGDKATLEYAYPYMKATAEYLTKYTSSATGLVEKLGGGDTNPNDYQYGIVDWPREGRYGYDWSGCKNGAFTTVNILSKHAYDVIALAAAELGNETDKADMESRSQVLKTAINSKLRNDDGLYVDGTTNTSGTKSSHVSQHANSFAFAFDVIPENDANKAAVADFIAEKGMQQGPMTADILAKGLFNAGKNTAALKLFTEPNDAGWARELKQGGTFTWEAWNADGVSSNYSQSHAWGATAASDILRNFAGVQVTKPGAGEIKITPVYVDLESLAASVQTERGAVGVSYTRTEDSFRITLDIPANVKADVELPNVGTGTYKLNGSEVERTMKLGSGEYTFTFDGEIIPPEKVEYKEVIDGIIGSDDEENSMYTWTMGNTDKAASAGAAYQDLNEDNGIIDLTVSLGAGDYIDSGIVFTNSSVKETTTTGQASLNDTKRYILVKPKYDGIFSMDIAFNGTSTQAKDRIYYKDLGTGNPEISLSSHTRNTADGSMGDDFTSTSSGSRTLTMTAGHTYILYTYQHSCTISAMSYKYDSSTGLEPLPEGNIAYEEPDEEIIPVSVTDCVNNNSKGGFGTGSENACGSRDILFQNIDVDTVKLHGIWMKTNPERGGLSENIQFKDMTVLNAGSRTATVSLQYSANASSGAQNPADEKPEYRYITLENIQGNKPIDFAGYYKSGSTNYIHDVIIRGCRGGEISYGKNFEIWSDSDSESYSVKSSDNIKFYNYAILTDTTLQKSGGSERIIGVDNENYTITVNNATPSDVKDAITGAYGAQEVYKQGYAFTRNGSVLKDTDVLQENDILTVTAYNGKATQAYTVKLVADDAIQTDTAINVSEDAASVYDYDSANSVITVYSSKTVAQLKADISSSLGGTQTYTAKSGSADLSDNDTLETAVMLTVTAPDGTTTKDYTIKTAYLWDFSEYTVEVKTTESDFSETYSGLTITLANNGGDADHDKITTGGAYWRGSIAEGGTATRYISYTPEMNGTLYVTGKLNNSSSSKGRFGILEDVLTVSSFNGSDGSSANSDNETTVSKNCTTGHTYYITGKIRPLSIYKIIYVPAE